MTTMPETESTVETSIVEYNTLDELYMQIEKRVGLVLRDSSEATEDLVQATIRLIVSCKDMVRREALFSVNEELDDITTSSLKYLFLDYFLGKIALNQKDFACRETHVMDSMFSLNSFIDTCRELKLMYVAELQLLDAGEVCNHRSTTATAISTVSIEYTCKWSSCCTTKWQSLLAYTVMLVWS